MDILNAAMFRFSHVEVPLTTQSLHLSEEVTDFVRPRLVNHKWTLEQKFTLGILVRWYLNTWKEKTILFNAYFIGAKLSAGSSRLFSEKAIRAMWHDLSRKKDTDGTSKMIWQDTAFSKASSAWAVARAALEHIANELGLVLQKRTSTSIDGSDIRIPLIYQGIPRPQRVTKRKSYHLPSRDSSSENEEGTVFPLVSKRRLSDIIQTPTKAGTRRGKISLLTPPSSSQKPELPYRIHNPSRIPKLVFRAFCDKSQGINSSTCIRAGSFMNSTNVPPAISSKSPTFKKHALRHINKVPNGPTPFVSVTSKLLGAFHRAFKMFTNPSIAVIDLELAGRLRNTQKEDSHPVAHSVKSLKLESPDNYRGASDWLVWGEIPGPSIISCNTIADLMMFPLSTSENEGHEGPFYFEAIRSAAYSPVARAHIRKARTPLTSHNGQAVGRLLRVLGIPASHLHDAIYAVITDWEFNASRSGRWKQNNEFMKGVHKGFRKGTSPAEMGIKQRTSDDGLVSEDTEAKRGDQGFHPQEGAMNMMLGIRRANSQASEGTIHEENAIDRADDGKQSSMNLDNEMDRRMLDEDWWAQAFRGQLEKVLDM